MSEMTRDVRVIAQEINQIKDEVRDTAIRGAIEIGKRLLEAKSLVPYGSWGKWLEDNVAYSERTAQDLMRIAKEYGRKETQALAEIQNKEQAVLLLALDAQEREQFVKEHDLAGMSTRELQEELERVKAEREKAQLTIEDLLGKVDDLTMRLDEGDAAAAATPHQSAEPTASPLGEALENEKQRADQLAKELEEARAKVAEVEKRRIEDVKREQEAAADISKKLGKATKERDEARREAEVTSKKLQRTEEELADAREQVRTVEVVPEAVEQELARLRAQASRSNAESEMRAAFDGFKAAYERLIGKLTEAESGSHEDAETARKYRAAFHKATLTMAERMK